MALLFRRREFEKLAFVFGLFVDFLLNHRLYRTMQLEKVED